MRNLKDPLLDRLLVLLVLLKELLWRLNEQTLLLELDLLNHLLERKLLEPT